jgi:hypothetical protein
MDRQRVCPISLEPIRSPGFVLRGVEYDVSSLVAMFRVYGSAMYDPISRQPLTDEEWSRLIPMTVHGHHALPQGQGHDSTSDHFAVVRHQGISACTPVVSCMRFVYKFFRWMASSWPNCSFGLVAFMCLLTIMLFVR